MEPSSLALDFIDDRDSMLPHPPIAAIYVQISARRPGGTRDTITADCIAVSELEFEVNRLKAELDSILNEARAKFDAVRKRH